MHTLIFIILKSLTQYTIFQALRNRALGLVLFFTAASSAFNTEHFSVAQWIMSENPTFQLMNIIYKCQDIDCTDNEIRGLKILAQCNVKQIIRVRPPPVMVSGLNRSPRSAYLQCCTQLGFTIQLRVTRSTLKHEY